MEKYLALLRGINVGGNNIIKMADLKKCFEDMGFKDVSTYIQSGNVIFSAPKQNTIKLEEQIENVLSKKFNYKSCVVIISYNQMKNVITSTPKTFGKDANKYRYDIIFFKKPLTTKDAFKEVKAREGVDVAECGKDVLYFSRIIAKATQSYLPKIIQLPIYKKMTIRNWNTATKLLELMEK